ncbi:MAG: hypothetical protein EHM24_02420 [Acidobacteria bacterium]|nr:MAG: hypothetical protein EHM24_02420 [Acidobacteriota bacterium]
MTGVFLFLTLRSVWNRARHRLRRLRQPRYVIGLGVGLVYLYWFIVRQQLRAGRRPFDLLTDPELVPIVPAILVLGALGLWLVAAVAWVWPSSEPPIRFTPAEVHFFYPAPVARRQLLHYKLLRSQLGVVFGVLVASLFSGALLAGHAAFPVGFFLLFSTLRLYLIGVGFTRASLSAGVRSAPWRAWIPAAIVAAISLVILGSFARMLPSLWSLPAGQGFRLVVETGREGPLAAALRPFQALIVPVLAHGTGQLWQSAWPAFVLLLVNYWWVLQSDVTLETAAATSERQQASGQRRAPAPAARRAPFALGPRGRPEAAIAWKNLIQVGRYASPRTAIRVLLPLVILAFVASGAEKGAGAAPLLGALAAFLTLLGPYMVRNDLRLDMTRLGVLKTWPVRGSTLFLGEVLAPVALLTSIVWGTLAVTLALSAGLAELTIAERLSLAALAALVAPAIILAQLVIQNGAVILFPGWIPTGPTRPRGIEAMGQQMLMFAGTLLLLAIGVLPAGAVAAVLGFVLYQLAGIPGLVPAGALFSAALIAESALVIVLLGSVLERTDPAAVETGEN